MNSLKNLFIVLLLAVVGYGVYISMKKEKPATPPPGAESWAAAPQIEMSGAAPAAASAGFGSNGTVPPLPAGVSSPAAPATLMPPGMTPPPGMAPPANPPSTAAMGTSGYEAAPSAPSGPATPAAPAGDLGPSPNGTPAPSPAASEASPPSPSTVAATPKIRAKFVEFMDTARRKLEAGEWRDVHGKLTTWYDDPHLSPEESLQLTDLLDQIAGTAIYSRRPILDEAYTVQPGDNLQRIAESYNVSWQLLAKINGIRDPQNLRPGQPLKVVRGPFQAVISLDSRKLTLLVGDFYAGHFPIGVGTDNPRLEGSYKVKDKTINPEYYAPDGTRIPAGDYRNPLGKRWINLGDGVGIHGTNDPRNIGNNQAPGSICLSDRDIDDVYDILSVGSRVTIHR